MFLRLDRPELKSHPPDVWTTQSLSRKKGVPAAQLQKLLRDVYKYLPQGQAGHYQNNSDPHFIDNKE